MKKKKKNPVFVILIILFGIYMAIYVAFESGYYEYKAYNKMVLTEEAMKKFEKDVAEGKDITLNDYIDKKENNYSNKISELGLKTSDIVEKIVNEGVVDFIKVFSKLFTN